jgi:hypothetical protein
VEFLNLNVPKLARLPIRAIQTDFVFFLTFSIFSVSAGIPDFRSPDSGMYPHCIEDYVYFASQDWLATQKLQKIRKTKATSLCILDQDWPR